MAYELLFQDSAPSWLHMPDRDATTVWELWDAVDDDGIAHESLNHNSKGAVIGFLHRYVTGLSALDEGPGYRRIGLLNGLRMRRLPDIAPAAPVEGTTLG